MEQGRIQIAHVEADVLRRSGASLQTMQATPRTPDSTRVRTPEPLPANVYLFLTWSVVLFTRDQHETTPECRTLTADVLRFYM